MSCMSVNASGGAARCSSVHCSEPPRITNSGCLKNQLAAVLSPLPGPLKSSPATNTWPRGSRRISRWAPSISSCSKRSSKANSERADTAATMRGSSSAGRACASCSTTSLSSNDGIQPLERTLILPIRTGIPSALLARCSIWGRHCSIRGKIPQCRVSHAISNKLHATTTRSASPHASQRRRAAITARRERGGGAAAVTGATMDMKELGSRSPAGHGAALRRGDRHFRNLGSDCPSVRAVAAI